ncbi:MAG: HAD hydrolase-like protein, partial [Planctomycetes bacterium]|nr:HAD hydrolase-like protein [Planctomycetota bacterium]
NASWLWRSGVPFLVTHPELVCPHPKGGLVDTGSMMKMFAAASGAEPIVLGKPSHAMSDTALRRLELAPDRCGIVGDRLHTDMEMGHKAGMFTVLVLSGETKEDDVDRAEREPDLVLQDVGELASLIEKAHDFS